MLNALQRSLPVSFQNVLRRRQDENALRALPTTRCDTTNLRSEAPRLQSMAFKPSPVEGSGAVNDGDQKAIYALTKSIQARKVLEIGTHVGGSTLMFARALPEDGRLTTVDILDVNGPNGACARLGLHAPISVLRDEGLENKVVFFAQDSVSFLGATAGYCTDRYDLIFLDGLHDADQVYREVPLALQCLAPNGLILMHDVFPNLKPLWSGNRVIPGPWLAIRRLIEEGADLRLHPLGALPWATKRGSNVTSLAYLLRVPA